MKALNTRGLGLHLLDSLGQQGKPFEVPAEILNPLKLLLNNEEGLERCLRGNETQVLCGAEGIGGLSLAVM